MSNESDKPKATYLKDYQAADYLIKEIDLNVELKQQDTLVTSHLKVVKNQINGQHDRPLVLDGEAQDLQAVYLDERALSADEYFVDSQSLTIPNLPESFDLKVISIIQPQDNTSLSGLYRSNQLFCTQCEAEGFRRITYFLDRPDNLAKFTTTIIADKTTCPVLLSNGNRVDHGELEGNRHWVKWQDPFNKPAYLFALVAGDLYCQRDTFTTASGKAVGIEIYVEAENKDKTAHAIDSLKKAMRWDENTYGLEYDLELYMIVAVNDFNMGAMENKGLNIFNAKYVLADLETATDQDFDGVESVIGHEYFHNWTGNRVTCRDWFQLSLKEGLTVFREQLFSADCGNGTVKRIHDVNHIRARQFAEDAGPLAHPVRPDSYIEINNFYTMTIYYKGAEVIRMMHTLLGESGFRKGMDLYFERHDGQAATTDNFAAAMSDANQYDLTQFKRWYTQAGTPIVTATDQHDPATNTYTLTLEQHTPPTADKSPKEPFMMPVRFSLVDKTGDILLPEQVLVFEKEKQTFTFENIDGQPIPSLFGSFSAPIKLKYDYQDEDLIVLMGHDPDLFNRWDAAQKVYTKILLDLYHQKIKTIPSDIIAGLDSAIENTQETALLSEMFMIPSFDYLIELMEEVDPIRLIQARDQLKVYIATALQSRFEGLYAKYHQINTELTKEAKGDRQLKNIALYYLMLASPAENRVLCEKQYRTAKNMTDRMGALMAINDDDTPARKDLLHDFYETWQDVPLVVNKWLALQAQSRLPDTPVRVKSLTEHKSFSLSNPNNVYALIRSFASNPHGFHHPSGVGYAFLAEIVLKLNKMNPQVAARVLEPLTHWRKYNAPHAEKMKSALNQILAQKALSNDVYELTYKSVQNA